MKTLSKYDASLARLIKDAQKEMFMFKYNKPFYTIDELIACGLSDKIPNLVKLNKKCDKLIIRNVANYPVLHIKYKKAH